MPPGSWFTVVLLSFQERWAAGRQWWGLLSPGTPELRLQSAGGEPAPSLPLLPGAASPGFLWTNFLVFVLLTTHLSSLCFQSLVLYSSFPSRNMYIPRCKNKFLKIIIKEVATWNKEASFIYLFKEVLGIEPVTLYMGSRLSSTELCLLLCHFLKSYCFWMLETNIFIKDTAPNLTNISKQICKHKACLFNWQHFGKTILNDNTTWIKTIQLELTLLQSPYIFNRIIYVPTWWNKWSFKSHICSMKWKCVLFWWIPVWYV